MTHSIHTTPPQGKSAGERHQSSNTVLFVAGYSNDTLIESLLDVGNTFKNTDTEALTCNLQCETTNALLTVRNYYWSGMPLSFKANLNC